MFVVPTNDLANVIEPLIEKLNNELDGDTFSGRGGQRQGAIQVISDRVAPALGLGPDAVPRRLWSIRARETRTTNAELAGTILIALGTDLEEHDLPVLPGTLTDAREMASVWRRDLKPAQRRRWARKLHRFANAYLEASADPQTNKRVARSAAQRRARKRGVTIDLLLAQEAAGAARQIEQEEVAA